MHELVKTISSLRLDVVDSAGKNQEETDKFVCNFEQEYPVIITQKQKTQKRDAWGKEIEFLLSCIAMSVGLGNVWRFPFTALENGGGAFVIPYIIVLLLVGKPIYLLEMVIGQFYSRGWVKAFDLSPALRGVAIGQVASVFLVATYYASILAITLKYLYDSFSLELPWGKCDPHWNVSCIPSSQFSNVISVNSSVDAVNKSVSSSAEIYFDKNVSQILPNLDNGVGAPITSLTICLAISWIIIFFIMIKGIKSSGKASYVLAIFPYVILLILFSRAVTLPGAIDGIIFFLKPQWGAMMNPKVWFDAVTQVFLSLAVCFGCITMYSSYNKFDHNLYRDVNIVTTIDTFTSLLAGCTIFGILGHLQYKTGKDVFSRTEGGPGLVFKTYPDAIAKFDFLPQVFSALFFLMFYTLGIGSIIAMISCVMTVIRDKFPTVKNWQVGLIVTTAGFLLGIIYVTPGGIYVLDLVDYFGASCTVYVFAIAELVAVCWIYGVNRFCKDIEFMLGIYPGIYWRLCWTYITPLIMIIIMIYNIIDFKVVKINDEYFPTVAYIAGGCLSVFTILIIPIVMGTSIKNQKGQTLIQKIKGAFRPTNSWGPQDPIINVKYNNYMNDVYGDFQGF